LFLGAEDVRDGDTLFKCAPPLRDRGNRERLWDGLRTGVIDLVASDHSPSPPARKAIHSGSFFQAWGGIASLGLGLSVVWTDARPRGFTIHEVVRWMAERPAGLAGLGARKGRIAPGYDADLVVWDPSVTWTVDENRLWYRHRLTPYLGRRLTGMVVATYLRGTHVYESGELMVQDSGMSLDRETGSV
jgi:allantoinase